MPARAHILRQFYLVQRLVAARGRGLPFAALRDYLLTQTNYRDDAGSYDLRTFQRDKHEIAVLLGVTIKCRRGQGYYIAETDALPAGWPQLFEALAVQEFLQLPAALGPLVQPEPRRPLGLEHLRPLLRAAQARQVVELDYQKHWDEAPSRRTCGPLLLREFRGRWYVLAVMVGSGYLACFGLDRIQALEITSRPFIPPTDFDPATYFAHCFGITRPTDGQPPEEIRLRFEPTQGRYALSFPLHSSQRVEVENEDEIIITLHVYDNHDLRMELLSYGPEVTVLAPATLRDWLREQHREAVGAGLAPARIGER